MGQPLAALCQSCISVWVKRITAIALTDIWDFGEGEEEHTGGTPTPYFQEQDEIPDSRLGAEAQAPPLPLAVRCKSSKHPQFKQSQAPAFRCSWRQKDL